MSVLFEGAVTNLSYLMLPLSPTPSLSSTHPGWNPADSAVCTGETCVMDHHRNSDVVSFKYSAVYVVIQ